MSALTLQSPLMSALTPLSPVSGRGVPANEAFYRIEPLVRNGRLDERSAGAPGRGEREIRDDVCRNSRRLYFGRTSYSRIIIRRRSLETTFKAISVVASVDDTRLPQVEISLRDRSGYTRRSTSLHVANVQNDSRSAVRGTVVATASRCTPLEYRGDGSTIMIGPVCVARRNVSDLGGHSRREGNAAGPPPRTPGFGETGRKPAPATGIRGPHGTLCPLDGRR